MISSINIALFYLMQRPPLTLRLPALWGLRGRAVVTPLLGRHFHRLTRRLTVDFYRLCFTITTAVFEKVKLLVLLVWALSRSVADMAAVVFVSRTLAAVKCYRRWIRHLPQGVVVTSVIHLNRQSTIIN